MQSSPSLSDDDIPFSVLYNTSKKQSLVSQKSKTQSLQKSSPDSQEEEITFELKRKRRRKIVRDSDSDDDQVPEKKSKKHTIILDKPIERLKVLSIFVPFVGILFKLGPPLTSHPTRLLCNTKPHERNLK